MRRFYVLLFLTWFSFSAFSGENSYYNFVYPLNLPPVLSANFSELRPNHFHSGVDFKTEQVIGKPVFAVDSGYVSRFNISGKGYGNCIYITHYNGLTSVYAHLENFIPEIDAFLKKKQYEQKKFDVDITLDKDELKVKRGQQIAWSGNTGSSGGPHLHFEMRDTYTEEVIDPLFFFDVKDDVRPKFSAFLLSPIRAEGVVAGSNVKKRYDVQQSKAGFYSVKGGAEIQAWGKVGLEIKANDYMPNTSNIYGINSIRVFVDNKEVFFYKNDRFAFDKTRFLNGFIDYEEWYKNKSMFMTTFVLPNNQLDNYRNLVNKGYLSINEERDYNVKCIVKDFHGNPSTLDFVIKGKKQDIPSPQESNNTFYMRYDTVNRLKLEDLSFTIPKEALYDNLYFQYSIHPNTQGFSDVYDLHLPTVPLQKYCELRIRLKNDLLPDKKKYYIAYKNTYGMDFVGNNYQNGFLVGETRGFGEFVILCDTIAPNIKPVDLSNGSLKFQIYDAKSGVDHYEGFVDGEWALFKFDSKKNMAFYSFDKERVVKGKSHKVELRVFDKCGNEATYQTNVFW